MPDNRKHDGPKSHPASDPLSSCRGLDGTRADRSLQSHGHGPDAGLVTCEDLGSTGLRTHERVHEDRLALGKCRHVDGNICDPKTPGITRVPRPDHGKSTVVEVEVSTGSTMLERRA